MLNWAKFSIVLLFAAFFVTTAPAQDLGDLGSSNGIFRSPNPKPTKSAAAAPRKKETAKPAPVERAKRETPARKPAREVANKPRRAAVREAVAAKNTKSSAGAKTPNKKELKDVVINVGDVDTTSEIYEQRIEKGNDARDARDYVAAEKLYAEAQKIKPRDSRAIYGLGNIYSDQQRWEEAEKAYRAAIALDPAAPEAQLALSFVLTQPVVGVNPSLRFAEAEKAARRAIEADGTNAAAYDQLGVALEMSGRIDDATRNAYEKAIKLDSSFAPAYAHLGRLLRRNGFKDKSASAYRDAIRLAADVPTMILVADVMQSQQKYLESEQLLQRALREDPKNPTALFLLGRAFLTRSDFDDAERVLKRSVEVSPNSFVAFVQLASVYSRRNNFAEAEKTLNRALRVVSANEKKRLALEFEAVGDGFARSNRQNDAVRAYRQASALDASKKDLAGKISQAQKR